MAVFEYRTSLPHPRADVFAWFARPGALQRLSPPFSGSVRREPDAGIEAGSTAQISVGAPGKLGLGLSGVAGTIASAVGRPGVVRPELPWTARHVDHDPGRSFTDVMAVGPLRRWKHVHIFDDHELRSGETGTVMTDRVDYELPLVSRLRESGVGRRLSGWIRDRFADEMDRIFRYRERQLLGDLHFHAAHPGPALTVAVAGASGAVGTQVCALLAGGGHHVIRLVRRPARSDDEVEWDPASGWLDPSQLAACDTVVNVSGSPLGRFTETNKKRMYASRVTGTALLVDALAALSADGRERTLVNASAIGYYGADPHAAGPLSGPQSRAEPLSEDAPAGDDFMARLCRDWEAACAPAERAGVRVVKVRTGISQCPGGMMLQRFLPLYVAGVGGPLGAGQWHSWISLDDLAGIYAHSVLDARVSGSVNAVAPVPVTAREYANTLGRVLNRPSAVPVPGVGPKLLLGPEGARELAAADQRVSSAKIEAAGYEFRHRSLEPALRHVLGRSPQD
ncbi:TIGR01777 family oxidoreductase [Arthrobacter castelli]|uniref:TIGR01777 family oxidoreductase n=1 Tax=Arthrobacter castelli TaxID=271431 RepID=UPI00040D8A67|nr:TIGR01777 family oxidoreductase [Arthrobacter castelli]